MLIYKVRNGDADLEIQVQNKISGVICDWNTFEDYDLLFASFEEPTSLVGLENSGLAGSTRTRNSNDSTF